MFEQSSVRDRISLLALRHAVQSIQDKTVPVTRTGGPAAEADTQTEGHRLSAAPELIALPHPTRERLPFCIVGAGAAGLYAALILDTLGIDYVILEASKDRIGGRLYTHRFTEEALDAPVGDARRYDYIDMGGMRYPDGHKQVLKLFTYVGIDHLKIKYIMKADNTLAYFNGRRVNPTTNPINGTYDIFDIASNKGGVVPLEYLKQKHNDPKSENVNDGTYWTDLALDPYVKAFGDLEEDKLQAAWNKVTQHDSLSTRGYMTRPDPKDPDNPYSSPDYPKYPNGVVEWLEMMNTGTGLYNSAFVESVMDAVDFGDHTARASAGSAKQDQYPWYCLDGGSDRLITAMAAKLKNKDAIKMGQRVVSINPSASDPTVMEVLVNGESEPRKFSQVICTVPLGCMSSINTDQCGFSFTQKTAIRALQYDASTKVAFKFKDRWWQKLPQPIFGGVTNTDLPARVVVYPSYGLNCTTGGEPSGVMIASYTWAQDARRMGSLANPEGEDALVEMVLNNLAEIHGIKVEDMGPLLDKKVISWYNQPLARGAFALFGPGQFGSTEENAFSLFASLKAPAAKGRLHIAGEATSIHHAWVLGAINSAWRAVHNAVQYEPALVEKLTKLWDIPDEEDLYELEILSVIALKNLMW